MKRFAKWTAIGILLLITVGAAALPLCDLWFAKNRDFEYKLYILCSGVALLLFSMIQAKIKRKWGKWTMAACSTVFLTAFIFLYNNLLHYLRLKPIFCGVDYSFLTELKYDLNYTGGLGIFRYVLYATAIMAICSIIIIAHELIITGKVSKCVWRAKMKLIVQKVKKTKRSPASFVVLDAPSGYGKTFFVKRICEFVSSNEIKLMTSEQFRDAFYTFIRSGEYHLGDLPMEEVFRDMKTVVIEDIDMFLSGREATQEEVAHIFLAAIENGISIIITGIDVFEKAPFFYWKMRCMNGGSEKYIIAR